MKAHEFLKAGLGHMEDRASTYDKPAGERSMWATVKAFEEITGIVLTEEQGWLFMVVLKLVRSQQGNFRSDNYEDAAAYCGLQGEAAYVERYLEKDKIVQGMRESQGKAEVKASGDIIGKGGTSYTGDGGISEYLGPQTQEEREATARRRESAYAEKAAAEAKRKQALVDSDTPNFDKYREVK